MSPLLCQLSYTAAAAKLTACGDRVKLSGAVPRIGSAGKFSSRIMKIGGGRCKTPVGNNVEVVDNRTRRHSTLVDRVPRPCLNDGRRAHP